MNKIKRFLKIYPITRNWILISNYPVPIQSNWNTSCQFSNNYRDIPLIQEINPMSPTNIPPPLLANKIRQCSSTDELFTLIRKNYSKLETNEIVSAIKHICVLSQKESITNLENQTEFIQLFRMVLKNLRTLCLDQVIDLLKIIQINHLQHQIFNEVTQSLFQLVRHSINDLSLVNIADMQQILMRGNFTTTPLSEALRISLPIVFKANFSRKLDRNNIFALHKTLRCICSSFLLVPKEDFNLLINCIHDQKQNITPLVAKSLLFSFVNMNYFPERISQSILQVVYDTLSVNMNELETSNIPLLIRKIVKHISLQRQHMFYHEKFIEKCIDRIIEREVPLTMSISILASLNTMKYASTRLLDYIAIKLIESLSDFNITHYKTISIFALGLIIANYKPLKWNTIVQTLLERRNIIESCGSQRDLIRYACYFATLDYYEPKMLAKVFDYQDLVFSCLRIDLNRISYLYQCVKTMFPSYHGPWPPTEMLDQARGIYRDCPKVSLGPALERGLGGFQYIKHNITTSLGHFIDHVIVMRKGGFPVAINLENAQSNIHSTESLESIEYPSGSQTILILNLPNDVYSINLKCMSREATSFIRSIEILTGHAVVPINGRMWSQLSEQDKIPHLMEAIKLKCIDISISENCL